MPTVTLGGVPDHLHEELKSAASRNNRSLNGEILTRLTESSVSPRPRDTKALLERIRKLRETIGPIDISNEYLRDLRNKGPPTWRCYRPLDYLKMLDEQGIIHWVRNCGIC